MWGLGRTSIQSVHARGVGGIEFRWMQILDEDYGRIRRFDKLEWNSYEEIWGLRNISLKVLTLMAMEEMAFNAIESLK
jgi:hypothetical protein